MAGFVTEGTEEKKMHRKPRSPLKWASMGTLMCGIGIQLSSTVRAGGVQVLFVSKIAEGSPAEQHLSIHDVIEQVDDKDMRGLAVSSVLQHILGPTDAPVTLDINRGDEHKRVIIMRQLYSGRQNNSTKHVDSASAIPTPSKEPPFGGGGYAQECAALAYSCQALFAQEECKSSSCPKLQRAALRSSTSRFTT